MRFRIFLSLILTVLFVSSAFAALIKEITLNDGSVIYGKIVGMENGKYYIQTQDMDIVNIVDDKVKSIKNQPTTDEVSKNDEGQREVTMTQPSDSGAVKAGIEALKRGMSKDKVAMSSIAGLQNDPDFMAALEDPAIMSAVQSADINSLMQNPKFIKLLNKPIVKKMESQIK